MDIVFVALGALSTKTTRPYPNEDGYLIRNAKEDSRRYQYRCWMIKDKLKSVAQI